MNGLRPPMVINNKHGCRADDGWMHGMADSYGLSVRTAGGAPLLFRNAGLPCLLRYLAVVYLSAGVHALA